MQLCGAGDDPSECHRVEGGPTDERAIDVRLGEELSGVIRRHAAAVQDRHLIGPRAIQLTQVVTDLGCSGLSVHFWLSFSIPSPATVRGVP